jgi:hypothetical protein
MVMILKWIIALIKTGVLIYVIINFALNASSFFEFLAGIALFTVIILFINPYVEYLEKDLGLSWDINDIK